MRKSLIPIEAKRRVSFATLKTTKPNRLLYKKSSTIQSGTLFSKESSKSTESIQAAEFVNTAPIVANKPTVVEIENIAGNTEVERKLNYNILPNKLTQMKLDYLLTPYNDTKYIYKFMNFNDEDSTQDMNIEEVSKERWNKISKIVLNKNKKVFRKTLLCINNKLEFALVKLGKEINKSNENYMDYEDLHALSTNENAVKKIKYPNRKNSKREVFKQNMKARASIIEKKDESQKIDKEDKRDSLFDLEIKKYMKKSPNEGLTHPRFSLAKKPSNDKKWSFKGLMSIPEVNDEPFLNKVSGKTSEASYKRVQYHKRTEKISKKELISLLLSGEHEVFKHRSPQTRKTQSCKRGENTRITESKCIVNRLQNLQYDKVIAVSKKSELSESTPSYKEDISNGKNRFECKRMTSPENNLAKRPQTTVNQMRKSMKDSRFLLKRQYTNNLLTKRCSSPPCFSTCDEQKTLSTERNPYFNSKVPVFMSSPKTSKRSRKNNLRRCLTIDQLI